MPRLIWSPQALRDMQRLHRFLAAKDADAARRAVRAIREQAALLGRQPAVGRPADGMEPEFREWPVAFGASGYVILYRYQDAAAVILALRHQKEFGY